MARRKRGADEEDDANGNSNHGHGTPSTRSSSRIQASATSSTSKKKAKVDDDMDEDTTKDNKLFPLFAGPKSSGANSTGNWIQRESILIGIFGNQQPSTKIASFDFDDTITRTAGTHVFSKSSSDWRFVFPQTKSKLLEFAKTHRLVIFSNQKNLLDGKKQKHHQESKDRIFKGKVEAVARELGVPIIVFAALEDDGARKPRIGMWQRFVQDYNDGIEVDLASSFYVGDAAGRPATAAKRSKDHSSSDLKFAMNVGMEFKLPEELYLDDKAERARIPPNWSFNPHTYASTIVDIPLFTPTSTPLISSTQPEMILFVGLPGCGKTSFARKHLLPKGYTHVNQDTLKTKDKCIAAALAALKAGKSVVVDNTNPDAKVRAEFVAAAKKVGAHVPVRAFVFKASVEICEHNSRFRALMTKGTHEERGMIPDMVFNSIRNRFAHPDSKAEGLHEVKEINFIPEFESEEMRKLWSMWH
ncbi:hypothetical protein HDU76_004003 [Blyttiomyces sp. JEL0837]|nr:hypothetical protein HDU76_004003 [Blyttiomyces sp. JEL0837]